jgi:hypothetical protein
LFEERSTRPPRRCGIRGFSSTHVLDNAFCHGLNCSRVSGPEGRDQTSVNLCKISAVWGLPAFLDEAEHAVSVAQPSDVRSGRRWP